MFLNEIYLYRSLDIRTAGNQKAGETNLPIDQPAPTSLPKVENQDRRRIFIYFGQECVNI